MAYNPTVGKSSILFSTATTIAAGESLSSDWIDMEYIDKVQLSLRTPETTYTGVTTVLRSKQSDSAPEVITSGSALSSFYMYNVICRQRYMKWDIVNGNPTEMTGTTLELKGSFGSSDKLSVLPLNNQPVSFSQAGLVRAVQTGEQPDGDFVNTKQDGEFLSTSVALSSGETYTSDWYDTDGWSTLELFVATEQLSAVQGLAIDFTDDVQNPTGSPVVRATRNFDFQQTDIERGFF